VKVIWPGDKGTANWKTCRCTWDRSYCTSTPRHSALGPNRDFWKTSHYKTDYTN